MEWGLEVTGGPGVVASPAVADSNPLILNRFLLRLRVDSEKQRIDVLQGDIGNMEVGLAGSGNLAYSTADPRLALGVAANRMSVAALKKLWLFCVTPKVRNWVDDQVMGGRGAGEPSTTLSTPLP